MIKISVIIPAYNIENYVEKCLISVKNQTLKDIEVIIVNDGSTDNTLEVINNTIKDDSRFRVIDVTNGGVVKARKTGLDASIGEYIYYIDGDDYIDHEALELMYNRAVSTGAKSVVLGIMEDNNSVLRCYDSEKFDIMQPADFIRNLILGKEYHAIWSYLHHRSLYDESIEYYYDIFYGEDGILSYQLLHKTNFIAACKEKPLYYYVQREASIVHKGLTDKGVRCLIFSVDKQIEYIEKYNYIDIKLAHRLYLNLYAHFYYLKLDAKIVDKYTKNKAKRMVGSYRRYEFRLNAKNKYKNIKSAIKRFFKSCK